MKRRPKDHACWSHPPSSQVTKYSQQSLSPQLPITEATNTCICTQRHKQSHVTHICIQIHTHIYMSVSPLSHTLSPTHVHRCTHSRKVTFQRILTCCHQVLLTLLMASRNQVFRQGHFYLLLGAREDSCHHNYLFTCKLWPRMHRKQNREESTQKISPLRGQNSRLIYPAMRVEPDSHLDLCLGPAPSVPAVSCWQGLRPSLLLCKQHRRRDKAQNHCL